LAKEISPAEIALAFPRDVWYNVICLEVSGVKRTYQPKKAHRRRMHGFLKRMSTRDGRNTLRARRRKGRQRLTA
jgi:large subunit ribosomal protein L34